VLVGQRRQGHAPDVVVHRYQAVWVKKLIEIAITHMTRFVPIKAIAWPMGVSRSLSLPFNLRVRTVL
jgi:hypothetical protein